MLFTLREINGIMLTIEILREPGAYILNHFNANFYHVARSRTLTRRTCVAVENMRQVPSDWIDANLADSLQGFRSAAVARPY